ncbi:MAG TPA: type II toxin-antitoxin system prevent-host-death family antitoxin [Acidimicrobiales bacterium]|nr:type II toxin-antitoxin system prevent-host-death family antitoxin [Acidimicrobiales bacterium]
MDGRSHVGIRELRNNVAAVVRRASNGERILITSDGEPVAMLGPVEPDREGVTLDDLIASGLVRPPGRLDHPADPEPSMLPVDVRADRVLDEIRGG